MKKLNVLAVIVAMLVAPLAFADDLGDVGENPNHVQGEKLDTGLGELTQQEIDRVVAASRPTIMALNSQSTVPAARTQAAMKAGYQVPPSNEGE